MKDADQWWRGERRERERTKKRRGRTTMHGRGSRIPDREAPTEGPPRRRGRHPITGRAPVSSWVTPDKTWCAQSAETPSCSDVGRYFFHVTKGTTCSALAIWLGPS